MLIFIALIRDTYLFNNTPALRTYHAVDAQLGARNRDVTCTQGNHHYSWGDSLLSTENLLGARHVLRNGVLC